MILAPDTKQRFIYAEDIAPNLKSGDAIFFGHGFNIRYDLIKAPADVDVAMVAPPKGPGHLVRRQFVDGKGVPALIAVEQDATGNAKALALSYAAGIGGAARASSRPPSRRRPRPTCSVSRPSSAVARPRWSRPVSRCSPRRLRPPEIAYFECLHELKLIVDLMYEGGIANERFSISDTAEYGDLTRGPRVVNAATKEEMKKILAEIQDGRFASEWVAEDEAGRPNYTRLQQEGAEHPPIEVVGEKLRG